MQIRGKTLAFILLLIMLPILTACVGEVPDDSSDSSLVNDSTAISEAEAFEPLENYPIKTETPEFLEVDTIAPYMELFMPIIDAYARLERSGYVITDEDSIRKSLSTIQLDWGSHTTIADSLFDTQLWVINNFGLNELPILVYALHDMTQAGRPELFIGVASNGFIEVVGIYVIETFMLEPSTEPEQGVRVVFGVYQNNDNTTLTMATAGHSVITSTRRNSSGEIEEYFQILGPGIGTGWLDYIRTIYPRQRFRVCFIGPCDYCEDGINRITEEEYLEVIYGFGTAGYDVEDIIEARPVNLDWKPVSSD